MKLDLASLKANSAEWKKACVKLPVFDIAAVRAETSEAPEWVHFGAGNIFRGFVGSIAQRLIEGGELKSGIIACETFDYDIISKIYEPFDNLTLNVIMNPDGTTSREVLSGIASAVKVDFSDASARENLLEIFRKPSLKMMSFTITEKGYQIRRSDASLMPVVEADIIGGPHSPRHVMSVVTALLFERFKAGQFKMAVVSMDNCSRNGDRLKSSVMTIAEAWREKGFVPAEFLGYLSDEATISFPWSMIDKITPRPHPDVLRVLSQDGIEGMDPIVTSKSTFIAPFVNAERPEYLVIEDKFPAGRPALEKAGVYLADRETVNKTERMKVTTCLNPLHTAMSMFGCLLGYDLICKEMEDPDIVKLVKRLGYVEGLAVVVDPGIISPKAFIDEVVNERLPNKFMPDDPRRIATDTSQKVGIRFGETIRSYVAEGRDLDELVAIPLALAAWMRYLLGVGDDGAEIEISPDPLKDEIAAKLSSIRWNEPDSYNGELKEIFSNATVFGLDICATELFPRIERYFIQMLGGVGAVRSVLHESLS
ncbi:MAG: mannitol dehydrogenase family protein [Kiritimatiellae bacterium]|nr:mannitol dehydrogenase family protein [Kiritimatiellia bacterium]